MVTGIVRLGVTNVARMTSLKGIEMPRPPRFYCKLEGSPENIAIEFNSKRQHMYQVEEDAHKFLKQKFEKLYERCNVFDITIERV